MKALIEARFETVVPEGSTVDLAAKPFHGSRMSIGCEELLTEKNFGAPKKIGRLWMRFLDVGRDYRTDEVPRLVQEASRRAGYKLRLGTPEEALLCQAQNGGSIPENFAVFGKDFNGGFIYWVEDRFLISHEGDGGWGSIHTIFLVEE